MSTFCSRIPQALKLSNYKGTTSTLSSAGISPSPISPTSPKSYASQSTATLTAYSQDPCTPKKTKADEAKEDGLPSYYAPYTQPSAPSHPLAARIDATRDMRLSLPNIDDSDTFTISTFSYYESAAPYNPPSACTTTPCTSTSTTTLIPPLSPPRPPPSPRLLVPQHSLPPPPRRGPRGVGSVSSFTSNPASRSTTPTPTPVSETQSVPEDVGPASYTQSDEVLSALPEREQIVGPSISQRTLGVQGGAIMFTVERKAIYDQV